jgi:hypothetical protein
MHTSARTDATAQLATSLTTQRQVDAIAQSTEQALSLLFASSRPELTRKLSKQSRSARSRPSHLFTARTDAKALQTEPARSFEAESPLHGPN